DGDDQRVNDSRLDEHQAQHQAGADLFRRFRLAGNALGGLGDGDTHSDGARRARRADGDGGGNGLGAGGIRAFGGFRFLRGNRGNSGFRRGFVGVRFGQGEDEKAGGEQRDQQGGGNAGNHGFHGGSILSVQLVSRVFWRVFRWVRSLRRRTAR